MLIICGLYDPPACACLPFKERQDRVSKRALKGYNLKEGQARIISQVHGTFYVCRHVDSKNNTHNCTSIPWCATVPLAYT
jgi:hypothetical protein